MDVERVHQREEFENYRDFIYTITVLEVQKELSESMMLPIAKALYDMKDTTERENICEMLLKALEKSKNEAEFLNESKKIMETI